MICLQNILHAYEQCFKTAQFGRLTGKRCSSYLGIVPEEFLVFSYLLKNLIRVVPFFYTFYANAFLFVRVTIYIYFFSTSH